MDDRGPTRLISSERRLIVEVTAALGLPLPPLSAVVGGAFAGSFDLSGGELQAGPDLISLDLGHDRFSPSGSPSCAGADGR
jgi:hypothetical protein